MNNKNRIKIDVNEKNAIMNALTNFVELSSGVVINKAYILEIIIDEIKESFKKYNV